MYRPNARWKIVATVLLLVSAASPANSQDADPFRSFDGIARPSKDAKWKAMTSLVRGSSDCTFRGATRSMVIEVKGGVLTARSDTGGTWTLKLDKLNRDGSGRIPGKTSKGVPVTFDFAAGDGAREIFQSVEQCVWRWSPS